MIGGLRTWVSAGFLLGGAAFLFWFADHHFDRGVAFEAERQRLAQEEVEDDIDAEAVIIHRLSEQLENARRVRDALQAQIERERDNDPESSDPGLGDAAWDRIMRSWNAGSD